MWTNILCCTKKKQKHDQRCQGSVTSPIPTTLFNIGSPEIEEAAVELIKYKLATSKNKTIELKIGGSKVNYSYTAQNNYDNTRQNICS